MSPLAKLKKRYSLQIYSGMVESIPQFEQTVTHIPSDWKLYNNCFSVQDKVICFVHMDQVYVTPLKSASLHVLRNAKFSEKWFVVPLSKGHPCNAEANEKWQKLIGKL